MWDDEDRFDDVCEKGEEGLESSEGVVSPGEGKKLVYRQLENSNQKKRC